MHSKICTHFMYQYVHISIVHIDMQENLAYATSPTWTGFESVCVCVRISICRSAEKEKEIKEVINLRTHRLASCTGKRRSSAAVATQPIRQILALLLLASASALLWTAAVTLASALAARLALGCSDIALQMRRLLMLRSLKHTKNKLINTMQIH